MWVSHNVSRVDQKIFWSSQKVLWASQTVLWLSEKVLWVSFTLSEGSESKSEGCRSKSVSDLTCKHGSVGQSEGLLIRGSSVRFRLMPRTQIHMDLSYIDPQSKDTKLLLKVIKAIIIIKRVFK